MLGPGELRSDAPNGARSSMQESFGIRQLSIAPPKSLIAPPLVNIDGQSVNGANLSHAVEFAIERLGYSKSFLLCTLNLDHLVKLRENAELRQAYARAELVIADGFPIVTLGHLRGCQLERATGSDLIEPLCAAAARGRLPIFLLGSTLSVLSASARHLLASCPGLEIAGVYAPPVNFDAWSSTADEAVELIRASNCRLCFLALGAPLQEVFALRAIDEVSGVGFLPIGAGLDFLAGTQIRCPRVMQTMNLEWAWRLFREPRRLGRRYAWCGILFARLLLTELGNVIKGRLGWWKRS
jgi:N-acetylglucosaminyldiphosphoundecaprenol N-acetyl-beta-D-mannosaminyltransferase